MRILGIDPGSRITGYGAIECSARQTNVVEAGVIRLDHQTSLSDRLVELHAELIELLEGLRPECVAVEKLYAHYAHPATAVVMGHARGVILLAAARRGVLVEHYGATQIKKFLTGRGRSSKAQVQRAVAMVLGLHRVPEPPDVADALAVALCCAHHRAFASAMTAGGEQP